VLAARLVVDTADVVGEVDERLFGSFVEHMGRAVYGGIYEPSHPTADDEGFRGDVLELVRELGVTIVRYPGGNFVSGYDWEDGVGPHSTRPDRRDMAWRSLEPNLVGTDEFLSWAGKARVEPMLAVNLGTRGADAARGLVAHCAGGVRVWCLGNEMDGPWQIGHKDAVAYGTLARSAAGAMRSIDPSVELVVCGSSHSGMPTFGAWEETVLELTWEHVDHISLHAYYDPDKFASIDDFLACSRDLDKMIIRVSEIVDQVAARKGSAKRIWLSVDEYNVWHMTGNPTFERADSPFEHAPALAEDTYTLADALVVGCLLITLLRHADRVRIACLAQLVNVLPAIRTIDGGPAWRQTIFYPFMHASRYGRGTVLQVEPDSPTYDVEGEGAIPMLAATAVHDPSADTLTIFAVNRASEPMPVVVAVRGVEGVSSVEHLTLTDADPGATNTADRRDRVMPRSLDAARLEGTTLLADLPPRSWNVVRLVASRATRQATRSARASP
jgi:alpha-N-arabinofuranosidase